MRDVTGSRNLMTRKRGSVMRPLQEQQCRTGMQQLQRFVRQHLGWHFALDTTQQGCPLPQIRQNRRFAACIDSFTLSHG
jgi:hypothetical protein